MSMTTVFTIIKVMTVVVFLLNSLCLLYVGEKRMALVSFFFAIANGLIFLGGD